MVTTTLASILATIQIISFVIGTTSTIVAISKNGKKGTKGSEQQ